MKRFFDIVEKLLKLFNEKSKHKAEIEINSEIQESKIYIGSIKVSGWSFSLPIAAAIITGVILNFVSTK